MHTWVLIQATCVERSTYLKNLKLYYWSNVPFACKAISAALTELNFTVNIIRKLASQGFT